MADSVYKGDIGKGWCVYSEPYRIAPLGVMVFNTSVVVVYTKGILHGSDGHKKLIMSVVVYI